MGNVTQVKACCAQPPEGLPEPPPGGPKWVFFIAIYAIQYMRESKQQNAFKRLPNLDKACNTHWEALKKKRVDHTYTPEARKSSYGMLR